MEDRKIVWRGQTWRFSPWPNFDRLTADDGTVINVPLGYAECPDKTFFDIIDVYLQGEHMGKYAGRHAAQLEMRKALGL